MPDLPEDPYAAGHKKRSEHLDPLRHSLVTQIGEWVCDHPDEALETFAPLGWFQPAIDCLRLQDNLTTGFALEDLCYAWALIGGRFELSR